MPRLVKLVAVAALAATVAFGAIAIAIADDDRHFPSAVKITKAAGGNYRGTVKSENQKCLGGRLVKVFHDSQPRFLIGRKRTKANGNWGMKGRPQPPAGDKVYAVVVENEYVISSTQKTVSVCDKDVSPKVTYPHTG